MTNILLMSITSQMGGGPKNLLSILKGIDKNKYHTIVVCPDGGEYYDAFCRYAEVIAMDLRSHPLANLMRLKKLVKKRDIRLAHSHGRGAGVYTRVLKLLCPGLKEVHTFHGMFYDNKGALRKSAILLGEHFLGKLSDRSICVSKKECEEAKRLQFSLPDRIRVIYNGISITDYTETCDTVQTGQLLGLKEDDYVIGCIARFDVVKGHRVLIGAFDRFRQDVPAAKLLLVGDGPVRKQIEEMIGERKLGGSVILAGTRKDVPQLLHCMDMFVSASYKEGLPYALIEALAAGVSVAATGVTGNDEIIIDGQNGVLCEAGNEEALYQAMKRLYDMPEAVREKMRMRGLEDVKQKFSEESMVRSTVLCYEEVL